MKEIQLTQEKVALVDDEDLESLSQYKWYAMKHGETFYAGRTFMVDGKQIMQCIHNVVLKGKNIDHIDHNGLNNQKENLRFCTNSENQMNVRKQKNCTSIYKGVCFNKRDNNWKVTIKINGKSIFLGYFISEIDAARAYDKKAIELFCEFANLNIIPNE